jgi:hypothetical protein
MSTIFIKNVWRWNEWYASYPVLYDECMEFVYNKCNMTNIFSNSNIEYNYDLLYDNFYNNKGLKFHREVTEKVYKAFNRQDEIIIFNKSNNNKNCVIYSHYDEDNNIKDYVIHGLKSLIYLGYDILFLTTNETIINIDLLPFEIIYIEKNKQNKTNEVFNNWLIGCNMIKDNRKNYEWILLLNDSILFPINGIDNFKNAVIEMRKDCDCWGHWDNYENQSNLIISPFEFKYTLLDDVINVMNNSLNNIVTYERELTDFLIKKGYMYKVIVSNENLNMDDNETIYTPPVLCQWIYDNTTFAVNWELVKPHIKLFVLTQEFNYLTRYLHYE